MRPRALFVVAGVALALLGGCSADASEDGRVVVLRIEHSRFIPDRLEVEPGSTVTFVVTNGDPIDHELIIGDETVQDVHEKGTEAEHGAKPGEISIPAGERRSTTYTFEDAGELIYGCHIPGHYAFGMRGIIDIR